MKGKFEWTHATLNSFNLLKTKLVSPLVLSLPNFNKAFEAAMDAHGIDIDVVLSQQNH